MAQKVVVDEQGFKTTTYVVPAGDRDAGKVFFIREFPALQAERWARRMFFALKSTTERIPENVASLGMVGVAIATINVFMTADVDEAKMEPLLEEMLAGVQMVRDKAHPEIRSAVLWETDVREVSTIVRLRSEVLELHTNFSLIEAFWSLISSIRSAQTPLAA